MNLEFKTIKQKQREALHHKVASLYVNYRNAVERESIKVSDHQLFCRVANECNMTQAAVRSICIAQGVALPKRKQVL